MPRCVPEAGGSVRVCISSSVVPTTRKIEASTNAALGNSCSATTVASGGPRMNTTSSISDSQANAVRSSGEPVNWLDHRALTSGPMFGAAAPAIPASR